MDRSKPITSPVAWTFGGHIAELRHWASLPESGFSDDTNRKHWLMGKAADEMEAQQRIIANYEACVSTWRPIETAPKDATVVVYRYDGHVGGECWWDEETGEWWDNDADQTAHPTHWIPRPRLP